MGEKDGHRVANAISYLEKAARSYVSDKDVPTGSGRPTLKAFPPRHLHGLRWCPIGQTTAHRYLFTAVDEAWCIDEAGRGRGRQVPGQRTARTPNPPHPHRNRLGGPRGSGHPEPHHAFQAEGAETVNSLNSLNATTPISIPTTPAPRRRWQLSMTPPKFSQGWTPPRWVWFPPWRSACRRTWLSGRNDRLWPTRFHRVLPGRVYILFSQVKVVLV